MSSGPETRYIQSIHRLLPKKVYWMKNHNQYNGGIADCWYEGSADDIWVEYKFIELPKRDTTDICLISGKNPALSALQQQWLRDRWNNGTSVHVIVGTPQGGVWLSDCLWEQTFTAGAFREFLETKQQIADRIVELVCG